MAGRATPGKASLHGNPNAVDEALDADLGDVSYDADGVPQSDLKGASNPSPDAPEPTDGDEPTDGPASGEPEGASQAPAKTPELPDAERKFTFRGREVTLEELERDVENAEKALVTATKRNQDNATALRELQELRDERDQRRLADMRGKLETKEAERPMMPVAPLEPRRDAFDDEAEYRQAYAQFRDEYQQFAQKQQAYPGTLAKFERGLSEMRANLQSEVDGEKSRAEQRHQSEQQALNDWANKMHVERDLSQEELDESHSRAEAKWHELVQRGYRPDFLSLIKAEASDVVAARNGKAESIANQAVVDARVQQGNRAAKPDAGRPMSSAGGSVDPTTPISDAAPHSSEFRQGLRERIRKSGSYRDASQLVDELLDAEVGPV